MIDRAHRGSRSKSSCLLSSGDGKATASWLPFSCGTGHKLQARRRPSEAAERDARRYGRYSPAAVRETWGAGCDSRCRPRRLGRESKHATTSSAYPGDTPGRDPAVHRPRAFREDYDRWNSRNRTCLAPGEDARCVPSPVSPGGSHNISAASEHPSDSRSPSVTEAVRTPADGESPWPCERVPAPPSTSVRIPLGLPTDRPC